MHSTTTLPEGYRQTEHINLQTDKKTALKVNIAAVVIMIVMFALGHFAFVPFFTLSGSDSIGMTILRLVILLAGYFAYIVLHELTHAAVMKLAGGKKLRFGFTGLYAYAGSEHDYFGKTAYILIALAPLVIWGVIFTIPMIFVSADWFWVIYFWQIGNIAGAAGDIYVTVKTLRMPSDVLIMDTGVEMFFYSK